jgi:hypothetical protein
LFVGGLSVPGHHEKCAVKMRSMDGMAGLIALLSFSKEVYTSLYDAQHPPPGEAGKNYQKELRRLLNSVTGNRTPVWPVYLESALLESGRC